MEHPDVSRSDTLAPVPPAAPRKSTRARDILALTKPRISVLSVATAAAGLGLAPGEASARLSLITLLGTLLLVGSASTLNMYLERDVDAKMSRTRNRPLPAGRLSASLALWFGLVQAAIAIPMLWLGANALTGALGALALVLYVLVYTPLKRRTTLSLLIGAIPGAMPPLLGWTAATGHISVPALAVFGVMFFWQIPHFIAIALFRTDDYVGAGLKILPAEVGPARARQQLFAYLVAQIAVTLVLVPLGLGGPVYLVGAILLGAWMLWLGLRGLRADADVPWARKFFIATVAYLPVLLCLLVMAS
jgi:protoheme IX farnesyltransferase